MCPPFYSCLEIQNAANELFPFIEPAGKTKLAIGSKADADIGFCVSLHQEEYEKPQQMLTEVMTTVP